MNFDEQTPTNSLSISGVELQVPAPFAEGHVCSANEANALNQLLKENTANNFRAKVKAAIASYASEAGVDADAEDFELPEGEVTTLQEELNTYLQGYEFGVRAVRSSGAGRTPVEKRMRKIANTQLRQMIKASNKKVDDFTEEQYESMLEALLERKADVLRAEAQRQLENEKAASEVALEELTQ